MMSLTISTVANSAIEQMFSALDGVLAKAAAHAEAKGVEEAVYLNWRLAPDMFSLVRQVQVATELPARSLSRLAGADMPSFADDETSIADLRDRIKKARDHIKSLDVEALDADLDGPISFPAGGDNEMTLPRRAYLLNMILPNLYFHVTATYAILRQLGVEIGKRDFLAVPG